MVIFLSVNSIGGEGTVRNKAGFTLVELLVGILVTMLIMGALVSLFSSSVQSEISGFKQQEAYAQARVAINDLKTTLRYADSGAVFYDTSGNKIVSPTYDNTKIASKVEYTATIYNQNTAANESVAMTVEWRDNSKKQLKITKKVDATTNISYFPNNIDNSVFKGDGTDFPIYINASDSSLYHINLPFKYKFALSGEKSDILATDVLKHADAAAEPTAAEGFISAGQVITLVDKWMKFVIDDDETIMHSSLQPVVPARTNQWYDDSSYEAYTSKSNWWQQDTGLPSKLYTHMPASMFAVPSSAARISVTNMEGWKIDLAANQKGYLDTSSFLAGYNSVQLIGGNDSTIYLTSDVIGKFNFNGISGPASGEPLNIICNGNMNISGLSFSGNVRVLVNGTLTLSGGSGTGNFMFLSNGNMNIAQSISSIKSVFLSSDSDITVVADFNGQMQAKNNITLQGTGCTYTFNGAVLKAYNLPSGMTVD